MRATSLFAAVLGLIPVLLTPSSFLHAQGAAGGLTFLEPGQPPVVIHGTVEAATHAHAAGEAGRHGGGGSNNLYYHGGSVETAPVIYLVFWGSQWNNGANDPSNEASILESFYSSVGGSSWSRHIQRQNQCLV
jgi:hypothetical protein